MEVVDGQAPVQLYKGFVPIGQLVSIVLPQGLQDQTFVEKGLIEVCQLPFTRGWSLSKSCLILSYDPVSQVQNLCPDNHLQYGTQPIHLQGNHHLMGFELKFFYLFKDLQ